MSSSFAYRHSPIWAQELLISAKSSLRSTMREGRAFGAMDAEIHKSEWWSERRLRAFKSEKLQMIAQPANHSSPRESRDRCSREARAVPRVHRSASPRTWPQSTGKTHSSGVSSLGRACVEATGGHGCGGT